LIQKVIPENFRHPTQNRYDGCGGVHGGYPGGAAHGRSLVATGLPYVAEETSVPCPVTGTRGETMTPRQPVPSGRKQAFVQAMIFVFVAVVASVSLAVDHRRQQRAK
jgi:hypothetical protein